MTADFLSTGVAKRSASATFLIRKTLSDNEAIKKSKWKQEKYEKADPKIDEKWNSFQSENSIRFPICGY